MLDWTDRHCRYFHRLIAPHVRLYTEMITTGALLHGDAERHLRFHKAERPLALQLGGSDPAALAACATMGAEHGYDEINLNCGCPSDRVQNGAFGACLMKEPAHVADCFTAMNRAVDIPVTIKCRIGIDDCDERPFLERFVSTLADSGCRTFIIHARKAWLQGLSPKENREIPPLRYDLAAEIKERYPHLTVVVNGGIRTTEQIKTLSAFDGVMIGREAYQNPWFLREIEENVLCHTHFHGDDIAARKAVARAMVPYIVEQGRTYGTPVKSITRHMIGLFHGISGGKHWRRTLSTEAHKEDVDARGLIEEALKNLRAER